MRVSIEQFHDWFKEARTGDFLVYHKGNLCLDRCTALDGGDTSHCTPASWELGALANYAMEAFHERRVHLFQRKLSDHEYEYIAVKRSKRVW